ncbi:uncharacterized protein LOC129725490 [Wyeomyia smithii]|uniref:uncharacterized protein LOC129725490 n=1 Tax=Wyeomyia smithii TaxID=174621 RepID=UPI00246803A9|nr:uncharacterized protein LOC129725490 [Wyeomyia smithii]
MLAAVRMLKLEFEVNCLPVLQVTETDSSSGTNDQNDQEEEMLMEALSSQLQENLNQIRCAVHTLQLGILDVVKKSHDEVKKLTDVAKKFKSVKYTEFFNSHGANYPPVWGQTRWGGIYLKISKFLEQRNFFTLLAETFPELDISDSWDFATQYEQAFKHVYKLTIDMQAEHVSLSDFFVQWLIASEKVKQTKPNPFASELVTSMEKRLQSFKNSRAFKMALYLDPRLNYAGS